MTIDEFLGEFTRIAPNYKWRLENESIRGYKVFNGKEHWFCPLSVHYAECKNIGIRDLTYIIALAVDNKGNSEIRAKLLKICGLD